MLFSYKAKLKNGEIFEDSTDAVDRFALARDLKAKGNVPISITEQKNKSLDLSSLLGDMFGKIKLEEQILFTKNLSGMLKAGLSLDRALSVLKKQTKNQTFIKVLTALSNEINAGGNLSTGLAKFPKVFSKLFVSMTKAGEESGNLAVSLSEIGVNLEKAHSLNKKVKSALIYPGVIFCAMIIIGVLMFAFVVPTLAGTFKELGVALPASTRFIIALGTFFSEHLILSFVIIISSGVGVFSLVRASFMKKYVDFIVLRLPVLGSIAKELNTARATRTLSSLLSSGVSIGRAIEIAEDVVQNIYYKDTLSKAKVAIEKGESFTKIFSENLNLYPVMMVEMVEVGEETGKLSEMLSEVAIFYEGEIENKTKNLSVIIEPVLMIFIGGAVGFFAISMISPLYSILGSIS